MKVAPESVYERAYAVLTEADPQRKVDLSRLSLSLKVHGYAGANVREAPDRPARPDRPTLLPPNKMPRRSTGEKGRVALIHALAHIELNAIDLAWDIILRFGPEVDDTNFLADWRDVAVEEADHFELLCERLRDFGHVYGDLPAHDGLWEAAEKTKSELIGRLAIIPMFLEARGVDTSPRAIERLKAAEDKKSATVLEHIYLDEIKHLEVGVRWFETICKKARVDPYSTWQLQITQHLNTKLKHPINHDARKQAGMSSNYWEDWI